MRNRAEWRTVVANAIRHGRLINFDSGRANSSLRESLGHVVSLPGIDYVMLYFDRSFWSASSDLCDPSSGLCWELCSRCSEQCSGARYLGITWRIGNICISFIPWLYYTFDLSSWLLYFHIIKYIVMTPDSRRFICGSETAHATFSCICHFCT